MRLLAVTAASVIFTALIPTAAWADAAPIVTQQPASTTVTPGSTATFTAAGSGTPDPTVAWQLSKDDGVTFDWANVTSTTLNLANATTAQNGWEFRAVFTNSAGRVTSAAAVLSVASGAGNLIVTTEPQSQTAPVGGSAMFRAAATGDPAPSASWQLSNDNGGSWSTAGGATTTSLTIGNVTAAMNGTQYRAVFTNGTGSLTTAPATLNVQGAAPPSGAAPPGGPTVTLPAAFAGQPYSVTLTATGGKAPYTWTVDSTAVLPRGLTLTPAGVLSGTPPVPGTFTTLVHVADSSSPPQLATETVSVVVKSPCPQGNVTFVCQAFVALLGRSPAPAEFSLWGGALHAGVLNPLSMALAITTTPEYRTDLVEGWFASYLHRGADPGGIATNVALMGAGASDEAVQAGILGSTEYGGAHPDFITALYKDLLGRTPGAAEVASWSSSGLNHTQLAASILNSPEYRGGLVAGDFKRFLGRAVDGPGLAAFLSAINGGETDEQIAAALVSSPEAMNRA